MIDFAEHPALFFDGVCNLCNFWVDWTIQRDKNHRYRFGSLQGKTAHEVVPQYAEEAGLSTVVLVDGAGKHVRSTAIGRLVKGLGGKYKLIGSLILAVPRPIRDWFYQRVANSRYKRWGKRDTCRLPTPDERELFLP